MRENMGFITNWDSKCCPQPGLGPASGFTLTALRGENTILWQSINLLPAKASSCFHQGKKKKKSKKLFSAKPQESCWSASPPGSGTRPVTDPAQHPPEGLGWDHKTSAAHLQKCMAAPQANTGWVGVTKKKIKMQSPLCHLLYCKPCLLIKGPSQPWMSSLAGRTDVAYPIRTKSWNTPRELHSHQPAPGWGKMQRQQLPHFSFWSCNQF